MIEKITNEDLNLYAKKVKEDKKYGTDGIIINETIKALDKYNDMNTERN